MKDKKAKLYYALADYVAAVVAWGVVAVFRWQLLYHLGYVYTREWSGFRALDSHFYIKWFLWIPILSVGVYFFMGAYEEAPFLKSRAKEIFQTLFQTLFLAILVYFLTLLKEYTNYWHGISVFFLLWIWLFLIVSFSRSIILQYFKRQVKQGNVNVFSLVVGSGKNALRLYHTISKDASRSGSRCMGYVPLLSETDNSDAMVGIKCLGRADDIAQIVRGGHVRCIVLAPERELPHNVLLRYLALLADTSVDILQLPQEVDYLAGRIRTEDILSVPLVRIHTETMPVWQRHTKRLIDFALSSLGLVIASPLMLFVAVRTRCSSQGPVLFRQQRVGKNGKLFFIWKFRSMVVDAEKDGPQLSSDDDPRITTWGRVMRKWRLDELPQLWNIWIGDMSFVGPRPERPYFVDLLAAEIPYYRIIFRVKPGLTSWGMVQFGYASNLAQMKERLKYDLLYLDNASLLVDAKILIYTVRILFLGKGK